MAPKSTNYSNIIAFQQALAVGHFLVMIVSIDLILFYKNVPVTIVRFMRDLGWSHFK